jgi:hypothetical protein
MYRQVQVSIIEISYIKYRTVPVESLLYITASADILGMGTFWSDTSAIT